MSIRYVESFKINNTTWGIEELSNSFYIWKGGCGVHEGCKTLMEARQYIYERAFGGILNDIDDTTRKLNSLDKLLSNLKTNGKSDVFNLAKFKIV
jgi:hypothetical protein